MNVLLLDNMDMFLDFSLRCTKAGHYVRLCISRDHKTGKRCAIGDGLVEKIENEQWQKHVNWADLIVTSDNLKWLPELDRLRRKGFPYFGPSAEAADLEITRGTGQEFLKKCGIEIIDYETFTDYGKAEKYVLAQDKRLVCKPDGDKDKALSYVSKSPRDMVFNMQRWQEMNKGTVGRFMLQEYVEGTEFSVAGWLGKEGFSKYQEECFEFKKEMNDDYGVNTGEMGSAIKYVEDSALARELLFPIESELMKMGCTGSVCVSCMVDENAQPWPTELTVRLGWPSFCITQNLHPDPCEWMVDLLDGRDTFKPNLDHAIGVVMALPPFPYTQPDDAKKVTGIPVWGLDEDNPYRDCISPCALMAGEAPGEDPAVNERCMVSAWDYLCIASGCGSSIREAKDEAYKAVKSLQVPCDIKVRTDIGDCEKELHKLQEHGFAEGWKW